LVKGVVRQSSVGRVTVDAKRGATGST